MIFRKITIIMFVTNAAVNFLNAAGLREVWGVQPQTGIGEEASRAQQAAESVGSGPLGLIDALGGATVAAIDAMTSLFAIIFAAPTLLANLGVPTFIVTFIFAPLYIVVAIDVIAILRGDSGI